MDRARGGLTGFRRPEGQPSLPELRRMVLGEGEVAEWIAAK